MEKINPIATIGPDDNVAICIWKVMLDYQWRTGDEVVELLKDSRYNALTIRQGLSNLVPKRAESRWRENDGRRKHVKEYCLKRNARMPENTRRMRTFKELGTKRGPRKTK